jgi:hypothetical protein
MSPQMMSSPAAMLEKIEHWWSDFSASTFQNWCSSRRSLSITSSQSCSSLLAGKLKPSRRGPDPQRWVASRHELLSQTNLCQLKPAPYPSDPDSASTCCSTIP